VNPVCGDDERCPQPEPEDTYYCLAFNTKEVSLPIVDPGCEDGKRYARITLNEAS